MRKHKYTMVEILAVVAIIAILAGIIFGATGAIRQHSADVKTRAMMKQIHFGLEECKRKFGYYPPSANHNEFEDLEMEKIYMEDGDDTAEDTHKKKYSVTFKKACDYKSLRVQNGNIVDYYEQPFQYKSDGETFTIFSKGIDGKCAVNGGAITETDEKNDDNVYLD